MTTAVYFVRIGLFLSFALHIVLLSSCKPKLIPSTNVPVTKENTAIVKFMEQYKAAVEKRSVDAIMELVAKDFSDNMGSDDPGLHLDYLGLKERLEKTLPRIQDVRLGMFIQHIAKLEKDMYEVVFYFNKQILMEVPSGEKWVSVKEVSRMVIRKRHDKNAPYEFEIMQGI
ncbi:MAG TPA: hypothetical protein VEL47_03390 [Myxococcota bacterium]|nr:hypothetical protein [Myxococcota bacterium]